MPLPLGKTTIATASPKSSLSSLFKGAAATASALGTSTSTLGVMAGRPLGTTLDQQQTATCDSDDLDDTFASSDALATTPGGTATDPTISFRIRNYSAVDVDGKQQTTTSTSTTALPIRINSSASATLASEDQIIRKLENKQKVGVDDFERLKVIGQGGYGKVFLVRKKETQTIYAMKVLKKATLVIHTKTVEHTKNERSILSQLAHPFIVKLHYAFQTTEKLYLILQYAPGGELFSHLANQRMFDEDMASFYIGELLLALEHLHGLGIIYRDLKPENVLLDEVGHVLLTDFGLSKVALETRTVCGTIEFTAPEVLDVQCEYGPAVDYWSLGVMLYDMLTGRPPFSGNNRKKVMEQILKQKVTFPPYLTSYAKDLLNKLLKKNPVQRLGSGPTGTQEIKSHSYFRKLNWKQLAARELEPPITPEVSGSLDTRNFDACFTDMAIESPPVGKGLHPFNPAYVPPPTTATASTNATASTATTSLAPPPILAASSSTSTVNSGTSTPTPANKKKKHRKKAEAVAAKAAAAAAAASPSTGNSPASVHYGAFPTTPQLESMSSDISLEINDIPTPLSSIDIPGRGSVGGDSSASEAGSLGVGNHFHGFSYVAEDGFLGMMDG
ncbi:UNVERIFIED_CONTAM: Ribosomal protein S6 kinase beta-1 [Siphonaria sp. JEL0065]|nr:Ribosomal protein S6 kinase beta-1 [Siphonaria sp. JEL0065]